MNCLFVGGAYDGQRLSVDGRDVRLPVKKPNEGIGYQPKESFEYERYEAMRFVGEDESFTIYVYRGLGGNDVLRMLIERYAVGITIEELRGEVMEGYIKLGPDEILQERDLARRVGSNRPWTLSPGWVGTKVKSHQPFWEFIRPGEIVLLDPVVHDFGEDS